MENSELLKNDIEVINKIIKKEIDVNELPKEEVQRLIKLCQTQNDNLDRRISDKERKITKLENKIKQYKK